MDFEEARNKILHYLDTPIMEKNGFYENPLVADKEPFYFAAQVLGSLMEPNDCTGCCSGNELLKAKLCQRSYLAGMDHQKEICKDAISRDEAIRLAEQGQVQGFEWQFKKLVDLPSVLPRQRMGHWVDTGKHGQPFRYSDGYICSECSGAAKAGRSHYCPTCGCKMENVE